jgi:hypothetical protein
MSHALQATPHPSQAQDQLQRSVDDLGGGAGIILNALGEEIKNEPCIAESPRLDE